MVKPNEARQGPEALANLFETHYERVVRYIAVRMGNRDEAEDMAAEVFVRALEKLHTFQWRGIPMEAWIFRIAHNITVDHLRTNGPRKRTSPLEDAGAIEAPDDPERDAVLATQREELLGAMKSLTDAQREVVALRFFGGLPSSEVARVMERSDGAVRELQSSALKKLRSILSTPVEMSTEIKGQPRR